VASAVGEGSIASTQVGQYLQESAQTLTATLTITQATQFKCTYHDKMGGSIEPVSQEG
jgi:hypothetical protein